MNQKITFFLRAKNIDYSIEKVFNTVISNLDFNYKAKIFNVKYNRVNFTSIYKNILDCYKNRNDINHITGVINYCVFALPYSRTIITIHDLISIDRGKGLKKYFFWFFFFYLPLKRVKYVTCISDSVRESLIKYKCCSINKITVIPNPISDEYIYNIQKFNSICPRILHIGTRSHKNLERVIQALENVNCHLIIVGNLTNEQKILLHTYKIKYTNKIALSDNEILNEYIQCDIVSFPSLYEGFGVPIIEAQAIGRVVLTSNIAPMNQIAGKDYFFINPNNTQSIRNGFLKFIEDNTLRENLIKNGLENIKKYRANVITNMYQNLYFKIINEN